MVALTDVNEQQVAEVAEGIADATVPDMKPDVTDAASAERTVRSGGHAVHLCSAERRYRLPRRLPEP